MPGWTTALGRLAGVTEVAGRFSTVDPRRPAGPPPPGQEPGRLDGHLRPPRRDRRPGRRRGAVGQRPHRRRLRHQLAVGRPLRATGRAGRWWRRVSGGSTSAVRLRYAGVAHAVVDGPLPAHRPRRGRFVAPAPGSSSSATTRPSPTCGGRCERRRPAPDRGRGLPRPAGHLRRRRQRHGPGPPGGLAGDRRRAASRPRRTGRCPPADLYTIGGGEDGPQVRAATHAARGRDPGRTGGRRRRRPGGVRRLPAGRPHASPTPPAGPTTGSGSST